MPRLTQLEIGAFDFLGAGGTRYVEDFVVVFLLGAFDGGLCFLHEFLPFRVVLEVWVVLFCGLKGAEGGVVVF